MHEESQGSRSETPNPYRDIQGSTIECKGRPSTLRPSGRTIWERALVAPQRSKQARQPPTSPQSTSQVGPGHAAHIAKGSINEGVRAHTRACDLRLQTTMSHSEAGKCMQQQTEGAAKGPFIQYTDMPSRSDRTHARLDNRRHELAGPRRRTSE